MEQTQFQIFLCKYLQFFKTIQAPNSLKIICFPTLAIVKREFSTWECKDIGTLSTIYMDPDNPIKHLYINIYHAVVTRTT